MNGKTRVLQHKDPCQFIDLEKGSNPNNTSFSNHQIYPHLMDITSFSNHQIYPHLMDIIVLNLDHKRCHFKSQPTRTKNLIDSTENNSLSLGPGK